MSSSCSISDDFSLNGQAGGGRSADTHRSTCQILSEPALSAAATPDVLHNLAKAKLVQSYVSLCYELKIPEVAYFETRQDLPDFFSADTATADTATPAQFLAHA